MLKAERLFTYDDYLTLPNDGKRYEIIDGELIMTPAPETEHQSILGNLYRLLEGLARTQHLGKVLFAPVDIVLSMTDVVQPDLVFVSRSRQQIITKKNIVSAPDVVVEILSAGTEKTDRTTKKALYERYGVKEYWIVDPQKKSIELYQFQEGSYSPPRIFSSNEVLTSQQLPSLALPVHSVFEI